MKLSFSIPAERYSNEACHGASCWRYKIQNLHKGDELESQIVELFEHREEMLQSPSKAIELPHQNSVESTFTRIFHQAVEAGVAVFVAGKGAVRTRDRIFFLRRRTFRSPDRRYFMD